MATKTLNFTLLLLFLKYIFTDDYLYNIHNLESITNGTITGYAKKQIRTACILGCRHNQNCDKPYFKEDKGSSSFGECWFVKNGKGDEIHQHETTAIGEVETFEDICAEKKCRHGRVKLLQGRCGCQCNENDWKLQAKGFCPKGNTYQNFTSSHTGIITKLMLRYKSSCCYQSPPQQSSYEYDEELLYFATTNQTNTAIIPKRLRYEETVATRVFGNYSISARIGEDFRVWYLLDETCVDVYAIFCD